ncbi:MAG: hypothetical protein AB8B50_11095 [Pirellulaceae bacterium]
MTCPFRWLGDQERNDAMSQGREVTNAGRRLRDVDLAEALDELRYTSGEDLDG